MANNYGVESTVNAVTLVFKILKAMKEKLSILGSIASIFMDLWKVFTSYKKLPDEFLDETTEEEKALVIQAMKETKLIPIEDETKLKEWYDWYEEGKRLALRDVFKKV